MWDEINSKFKKEFQRASSGDQMNDVYLLGRGKNSKGVRRREKLQSLLQKTQSFITQLGLWKKGQLMVTPSRETFKEMARHLSTQGTVENIESIPCSIREWGVGLMTSPKVTSIPKDHMPEGHQIKIKSINHEAATQFP